jgi:hypothetical protein
MATTLSFADADARFQLAAVLPAYDEDEDVVVLPAGQHEASAIDLDEHSYVVDGDLDLSGTLRASEEGRFLVVRGNLRVGNLLIGGPIVHVTGSLSAAHAIHTDYNHGLLTVLGDVHAQVIAAEHLFRIGGTLSCETTIDFGGFDVADPEFTPTLTRQQAARESRDYLVPEVLNSQGYVDGAALSELLADGRMPLR